jgi:hypothetical protein
MAGLRRGEQVRVKAHVRGGLSVHNVAIPALDYDERRIEFIIDVSIVFMLVDWLFRDSTVSGSNLPEKS